MRPVPTTIKTRKNLREIGAGVYYMHSKRSYQWCYGADLDLK